MFEIATPLMSGCRQSKDLSTLPLDGAEDRILQAARNVVIRHGIRGLTIQAIAIEADRQVGTIGRFKIYRFLEHILDYPFACVIAAVAPVGRPGCGDQQTAYSVIENLLQDEPQIAALAVASLSLGAANDPNDTLSQRFGERRRQSITLLRDHAATVSQLSHAEANDFATSVIERFFDRCVRKASIG